MLTDRELALDEEELTKRKQKAEDMSKLAGDQIAQATAKVTVSVLRHKQKDFRFCVCVSTSAFSLVSSTDFRS